MYKIDQFPNIKTSKWTINDAELEKIISQLPHSFVILHGHWFESHQLKRFKAAALKRNKSFSCCKINPEPELDEVVDIRNHCEGFKSVLAIGSGSVIDAAKLVCIQKESDSPLKSYLFGLNPKPKKPKRNKSLIAFPINWSSSSHISDSCVVTYEKYKHTCFGISLLPDLTYVDSLACMTMPAKLYTLSTIDALSHVIEIANGISDENLYKLSLEGWIKDFIQAVEKKNHTILYFLSTFLYSGFFNKKNAGWPMHCLSHSLGPKLSLSHAETLVYLFPFFKYWYLEQKPWLSEAIDYVDKQIASLEPLPSIDDSVILDSIRETSKFNGWIFPNQEPNETFKKIMKL
jgi:alcohol dehydrogenase class IV